MKSIAFIKTIQQSEQFLFSSFSFFWNGFSKKFSTASSTTNTQKKVDSPETALRKHMKKFILKIHPDLFAEFPKQKQVNEDSLSKLNQILDATMKNQTGPINNWMTSQPITLTFFAWKGEREKADFKQVRQIFDIRGISTQEVQTKTETAVYKLLEQCGLAIPPDVAHRQSKVEIKKKILWEDDKLPSGATFKTNPMAAELSAALRESLHLRTNAETSMMISNRLPPKVREDLNPELILFDPDLSFEQKKEGLDNICRYKDFFDAIIPTKWADIPIIVTSKWKEEEVEGCFVIPYNFNEKEVTAYVHKVYEKVRKERNSMRQEISDAIQYKERVKSCLDVNAVLVSTQLLPHQSHNALKKLIRLDLIPKLVKFNLKDIDLFISEIPDKYKYDYENGGIQIPFNFTQEGLIKFLDQNKLRALKIYHKLKAELESEIESVKKIHSIKTLRFHANYFPTSLKKKLEGLKQISITFLMIDFDRKIPTPNTQVFITEGMLNFDYEKDIIYIPYNIPTDRLSNFFEALNLKKQKTNEKIMQLSAQEIVRPLLAPKLRKSSPKKPELPKKRPNSISL